MRNRVFVPFQRVAALQQKIPGGQPKLGRHHAVQRTVRCKHRMDLFASETSSAMIRGAGM